MKAKTNRGGTRTGAGRKKAEPTKLKTVTMRVTEAERANILKTRKEINL